MHDDKIAIHVANVSKTFKLPHEKTSSVKGMLINIFNQNRTFETQRALENVSFEVSKGDFFGIVGKNGSGKSTLLKLLAGIYTPTAGEITVNGRLTPFIELGVGFNPELTGRENVYLNGALLGFNRKEMNKMYNSIVEFAELERFMDQKLKNYSSGMQVRLAFSIAIRADSDILVLDEVLAVGDEAFQKKCLDIFESYKANKKTVVLVTHDMDTVRRFCTKAILINDGEIIESGEPNRVATKYSRINLENALHEMKERSHNNHTAGMHIKITNSAEKNASVFNTNDVMELEVSWPQTIKNVKNVGVAIIKNSGEYIFGANTLSDPPSLTGNSIKYSVHLSLGPGKYYLMAGLFGATKYDTIEFIEKGPEFMITSDPNDTLDGLTRLDFKWSK